MMKSAFIIAAFLTTNGWAQETPRLVVERVIRPSLLVELGDIEQRFSAIEKRSDLTPSWRPEADQLLTKAEAATLGLFRLDGLRLKHRNLKTKPEVGDILEVLWEVQSGATSGYLALQDTATASVYSMKLRSLSVTELAVTLPHLVAYSGRSASILIEESASAPGEARFGFQIQEASRPVVHSYRLQGARKEGDWLLELVVGKARLRSYYGDTLDIKERAPALEDLARNWSDNAIIAELAKRSYPPEGEGILVRELVRRGTTDRALLELVRSANRGRGPGATARYQQVTAALGGVDRTRLQNFRKLALELFVEMGPQAEESVESVFSMECDEWVEGQAAALLKRGYFLKTAVYQLGRCGISDQAFQVLSDLPALDAIDSDRKSALIRVGNRRSDAKRVASPTNEK